MTEATVEQQPKQRPKVEELIPYLVAALKEIAAGAEERLAVLQESGYRDEAAAKELLTVFAAAAGAGTTAAILLGMTPTDFGALSKQVTLMVLADYDTVTAGN